MKTVFINSGWTFTQQACLALERAGFNLFALPRNKGFSISEETLYRAGVMYVRGTPETKGLLKVAE